MQLFTGTGKIWAWLKKTRCLMLLEFFSSHVLWIHSVLQSLLNPNSQGDGFCPGPVNSRFLQNTFRTWAAKKGDWFNMFHNEGDAWRTPKEQVEVVPESSKGLKFEPFNHQKQTWRLKFDTLGGSRYIYYLRGPENTRHKGPTRRGRGHNFGWH